MTGIGLAPHIPFKLRLNDMFSPPSLYKLAEALIIAILVVLAPAKSMVIASLAFIGIDLITGILAAKRRGDRLTSAGLKRTIVKVFVYESAILLGFIAETYLIMGVIPVAKIISSFVGVTELKSVLENIDEIGGGDLLKTLLKQLSGPNE